MISALLICYNEEKIIRRCLESIKWIDEIVVVDAYSTDETLKICKQYTDKIYEKKWEGFSRQKIFGLTKCNGDWIFSIDADEICTEELKNEIISKTKENNTSFDGFLIPRKNFFRKKQLKFGGSYPDYQLRLFRKSKATLNDRLVHESFTVKGKISKLNNPLEHYPYRSFKQYIDKINSYTTLSAEEKYTKGKKTNLFLIIFKPLFEFKKNYFLQLGFLDGFAGFYKALFHYITKLLTEIKLWELIHNNKE